MEGNNISTVVSSVTGVVFSLLPELIPGFTAKWGALSDEWKCALRSYAGAVVLIVLTCLHFFANLDCGLGAQFDAQTAVALATAYAAFVLSAEGVYQVAAPLFPRKRNNAQGHLLPPDR